ncbi:hypothetical protein ACVWW6_006044 [Bradyrhizobium sp. USDA 3311]
MSENAAVPLRKAKHEAVLQAYFADPARVGFKAYLAVYPRSSDAAAKTGFSRLLKNVEFAARLQFLDAGVTEKVVEKAAITIDDVIAELAKIGFANAKDYIRVTADGDPYVNLGEMTPEQSAAVSSITVEDYKDGRGDDARDVKKISFRLHDKRAALVSIGEHLGGFKKRHEHTGADGGPIKHDVDVEQVSEVEFARRIAFALEKGMRAPKPTPSTIARPNGTKGKSS